MSVFFAVGYIVNVKLKGADSLSIFSIESI